MTNQNNYIFQSKIYSGTLLTLVLAVFCFFTPILFSSPTHASALTDSPSIEQRYNQAKFYFNQLLTNSQISSKRANWTKGAQNFRRIYLSDPKSPRAAACLYMLGRLYHRMYQQFDIDDDLEESISYYKDTARLFSEHKLADDSYHAIGLIYMAELDDPKNAAKYLIKVVRDYPTGDMHPLAADTLKQLSRDHDIALPDVMVGSSNLSKLSYVLPVKYWSSNDYTRVVIMASGPVNYREELLKETRNMPRRLYIDFHESYIEPQYRAPIPIEDGLLRRIRTGQFSKDTVRVVLDIESINSYKIYSLPDPFRVVIDVRGKEAGTPARPAAKKQPQIITGSPKQAGKPRHQIIVLKQQKKYISGRKQIRASSSKTINQLRQVEPTLSLAQQLGLGVRRIVLDPGHGGKDPGAIANGLKEKDIVLSLAKKLQPLLEREIGCEVLLTRDDDSFISLEERTAIANTQGADLFISLHINAHPSSKVRGLETYYLNLSTNAEAMRVAARENATSTHQMSELQDILSDILKNSKVNESSRLAQHVHEAIIAGLSDNAFGTIRNLGVKQAPFYVLIGAEMPAILLEIAFISNKEDARNLTSEKYLTALARKISQGIQSYVNGNTASLQTMFYPEQVN